MSDTSPRPSRIHALIIGINEYQHEKHKNLKGCVADAKAFMSYLIEDLRVPQDQILYLQDEQATRQGILNGFLSHLINNPNIERLDPIVIYFAGHGARVTAPPEWHSSDGMCELILPHDASWSDMRKDILTNVPPIERENFVHGIPDQTIRSLIHRLHELKGDNIVVILDSCFSASSTRSMATNRNSEVGATPHNTTDSEIRGFSPINTLAESQEVDRAKRSGVFVPLKGTHILLAACPSDKTAQEGLVTDQAGNTTVRGLFTFHVLRALRACNLSTTSYSGLMDRVAESMSIYTTHNRGQVNFQTPQCEGSNRGRILFQTEFALTKGMLRVLRSDTRGEFLVKAGNATGVTVGTVFDIYSADMAPDSDPAVQLVATQVRSTEATLSATKHGQAIEIPGEAYAKVAKSNDYFIAVRVLVVDRPRFDPIWEEVFDKLDSLPIQVTWTRPDEPSDLTIKPTRTGASLQSQPSALEATKLLETEQGVGALAETLEDILAGIAHFNFHLRRQNHAHPLRDKVGIQLFELEISSSSSPFELPIYGPKTNTVDLFSESIATGSTVELREDPEKRYGLMLTNNSGMDLFPYVLYYDPQDYSITSIYTSIGSTKPDDIEPENTTPVNTTHESTRDDSTTPGDTAHNNTAPDSTASPPLSSSMMGVAGPPGFGGMFIGYGSNGDPLQMKVPDGYTQDLGYFVLLVSRQWVDIEHITQDSPFMEPRKGENKEGEVNLELWDTVTVKLLLSK
ncbi:hypothetical protein BDV93DRAFT_609999 [Ceratobasidium sp. AG-I]|nr:hypothetical protein BDV93DRAFT_609999 [Ceratobasidium sp. AG-I]